MKKETRLLFIMITGKDLQQVFSFIPIPKPISKIKQAGAIIEHQAIGIAIYLLIRSKKTFLNIMKRM